MANAPSLPSANWGKYFSFSESGPAPSTTWIRLQWNMNDMPVDPHAAETISIASVAASGLPPRPPYSFGTKTPSSPDLPSASMLSRTNVPSWSC